MVNFQTLPKIELPQKYFDMAVRAANQKAGMAKIKVKRARPVQKAIYIETQVINTMNKKLQAYFNKILISFPRLEQLSYFYQQLCELRFDKLLYHQKLSQVKWSAQKIHELAGMTINKIHRANTIKQVTQTRQAFYGRVGSILNRMEAGMKFLEQARRSLKAFPDIKDGVFTICICGFPNVGKSTLLSRLTSSTPEIAAYAFTTKTLNTGTIKTDKFNVQLVDTPGTLNREKMNKIEQEADLAIQHVGDVLIYIFDLTEQYPLKQQYALLTEIEKTKKPILIYLSKTDILDAQVVAAFEKSFSKSYEFYSQPSLPKLLTALKDAVKS